MNKHLFISRTVILASLLVFPLILPVVSSAAEPEKGGTRSLQNLGLKQIASESVKDSLKGCLNRIPADASPGQVMMAEQGCRQNEANRKTIQLTF